MDICPCLLNYGIQAFRTACRGDLINYTNHPLYLRTTRSNKVDALQTHTKTCNKFHEPSLLWFMESWLQSRMPASLFSVSEFTLVQADRDADARKIKRRGICGYINNRWWWK